MSDLDKMMEKLGKKPEKEEDQEDDEANLEQDEEDLEDDDEDDEEEEEKPVKKEKPAKKPKEENLTVGEEVGLLQNTGIFRRELLSVIKEHNEIQKVIAEALILIGKMKKKK